MLTQSMSGMAAQQRIDKEAQAYGRLIRDEMFTLSEAHSMLIAKDSGLDLFGIAGLAKAIACFQCSI